MRGTPYFQAIFMVAVFLLAGLPVYRLTRPAAPVAVTNANGGEDAPTDNAEAKLAPLEVEAVFAPAPTDFQIQNLDHAVLAGRGPQARFAGRWTTAVPSEGVDLVIHAHWSPSTAGSGNAADPAANPAAAQVIVRFPDGRKAEKSFWADANGTLDDVLTVPGEAATPAP